MKNLLAAIVIVLGAGMAAAEDNRIRLYAPAGEVVILRELTSLSVPSTAPAFRACVSPNDELAEVSEQVADGGAQAIWLHIRVVTGLCAGTSGWIAVENARAP